jgi:RNA polymerase sigma-70 factor (ECF subfamily)
MGSASVHTPPLPGDTRLLRRRGLRKAALCGRNGHVRRGTREVLVEAGLHEGAWTGLEEVEGELREILARRCRDVSEVDDVLQETYLRAARHRGTLSDPTRLRGWATRIALNALRDIQRRNSRLPRADLGEAGLELLLEGHPQRGADGGPPSLRVGSRWIDRGDALRELAATFGQLPPHDRRVLESYYGGGQCGERTARECGLPRSLVKVRLFRARRRLERLLRPRLLSDQVAETVEGRC